MLFAGLQCAGAKVFTMTRLGLALLAQLALAIRKDQVEQMDVSGDSVTQVLDQLATWSGELGDLRICPKHIMYIPGPDIKYLRKWDMNP